MLEVNPSEFRRRSLFWFRTNGRDLPWRRTRDPYAVLVSEFMLQQTQVATVLPYYREWLRRFPSFAALARAPENDVLHAWQGLGYYARARNLHATSRLVTDQHRGRLPRSVTEMVKLPGIGRYTAHAIATFAFGEAVPIVETNVSRVLSRVFDLRQPADSTGGRKLLWDYATMLVSKKSPAEFNSALLDLGALICVPLKPKCHICPVKNLCAAKNPELLPVKRARPTPKRMIEQHALVVRRNRILLESARRRWLGMWILPATRDKPKTGAAIYQRVFPFTNHRILLEIVRGNARRTRDQRWFSKEKLDSIPIPSPHRRAIHALLN